MSIPATTLSAHLLLQKTTNRTRLLISLVDSSELTLLSKTGYPDFIDIKNPLDGSLGFPNIETVKNIAKNLPDSVLLSVAIGDANYAPPLYSDRAVSAVEAGADIVKVGLYNIPHDKILYFLRELKRLVTAKKDVSLVAGLYGDRSSKGELLAFPEIVAEAEWDGCLIDTYLKDGKKLTDYLEMKTLAEFVESCRGFGVASVIAGGLSIEDSAWIERLSPSIVGFRGAVAKGKRGEKGLDRNKVEKLLELKVDLPVIT